MDVVEVTASQGQKLMDLVVRIQLGVQLLRQFVTEQVLLKPVIAEIQEQQREQALRLVVLPVGIMPASRKVKQISGEFHLVGQLVREATFST